MKNIRQEIAIDIVKSGWLTQQCRSVCHNHSLVDDLQQEILLIVLEYKPESALDKAYAEGKHLALIRKVITNQWRSSTSPFYMKYRRFNTVEINEDTFEDTDYDQEDY